MALRLAFLCLPGPGHVTPTLPLVRELSRRGHEITYFTGERFTDAIRTAGGTPVPIQTDVTYRPPTGNGMGPESFAALAQLAVSTARADVDAVLSRFQDDPPDALCYDSMSIAATPLATRLGVPMIATVASFATNERSPRMPELPPDIWRHPAVIQARHEMESFFAEYPPAPDGPPFGVPGSLNIVFVPPEIQPATETFDETFHFVGPSLDARENEDGWQPPRDGKPLLFISLGTAFNNRSDFYRMCLEAFGDGSWHVALAVGDRVDIAELGDIPANIDVRRYFPQPVVLRHADAFVSHAGMNSIMESLYYAVPLVTVPQMQEQEFNADRVAELGLGRRLDPANVSADSLRLAVTEVSADDVMRSRLAATKKTVRDAGGAVAAADAIEAHLS